VKLPTLFLLSGLDNSTLREHIIHRCYRRIPETQYHVGVGVEPSLSSKVHTHELHFRALLTQTGTEVG
jgi:hypothetical protein